MTACGGDTDSDAPDEPDPPDKVGSLSVEVRFGEVTLETIAYEILGPNNYKKPGAITVDHAGTMTAVMSGIPAGDGYTITLSAVDAGDPDVQCGASATFDIVASAETKTIIDLQCTPPAPVNVCPLIDAVSATPAEVMVGESVALSAQVSDSDELPMPATFAWTSSGGTLTGAASPAATFICTETGLVTITLDVSDGECGDSLSTTVTCAAPAPVSLAWQGEDNVRTVDGPGAFGSNVSGLTYEPATATTAAVLWAVRNAPGTLYRLLFNGTIWTPDPDDGWGAGKSLHFPGGTGDADSEGVTKAEYSSSAVFVATERDNAANAVSRMSVLRVDTAAVTSSLSATLEWNLTSDLPVTSANAGLEGITWVPDSYLVAKGFFDEVANRAYNPADYPDHGTGLFLVGMEQGSSIYAYALNQLSGAFWRIATIPSGNLGVMSLEFDRDVGYLWAGCDDTCGNDLTILDIDANPSSANFGRFYLRAHIARPSTMENLNNEGFAFAPESECVAGFRSCFWADDTATGGNALRTDSIPCGPFL